METLLQKYCKKAKKVTCKDLSQSLNEKVQSQQTLKLVTQKAGPPFFTIRKEKNCELNLETQKKNEIFKTEVF